MFLRGCVSGFKTVKHKGGTDQKKLLTIKVVDSNEVKVLKSLAVLNEDLENHERIFVENQSLKSCTLVPYAAKRVLLNIGKDTPNEIHFVAWLEKVAITRKTTGDEQSFTFVLTLGKECSLNEDHMIEWFVGRVGGDGKSAVFCIEANDGEDQMESEF